MQLKAYPLYGPKLSVATFPERPGRWETNALGTFLFSADAADKKTSAPCAIPCMRVALQRLDGDGEICEVWHGSGQPTQGRRGDLHYCHDDEVLFGVIALRERTDASHTEQISSTGAGTGTGKTPLQQAAESAYRQIFSLLDTMGYPHPLRIWNYIADINGHSFGLERYRQFNMGRQDAFLAHERKVVGNVPAACALGSAHGPLTIAFLAGRTAPLKIENPRQTSAYLYPQQYGPRSPTFSRASLAQLGDDRILFISGTASVVGHATLHPGDVVAQTRETMTNIRAVLAETNRRISQSGFDLPDLHYRVYVRHPADLEQIRTELTHCVGGTPRAIYLQADVCRSDLLLEIEAAAVLTLTSAHGLRD